MFYLFLIWLPDSFTVIINSSIVLFRTIKIRLKLGMGYKWSIKISKWTEHQPKLTVLAYL